jgi:hypothetical protein
MMSQQNGLNGRLPEDMRNGRKDVPIGLSDDTRRGLELPFEVADIRRDRQRGNFVPTYVEGSTVIRRLNDTVPGWSHRIFDKPVIHAALDLVIVGVTLEVPYVHQDIVRVRSHDAYGQADLKQGQNNGKPLDLGFSIKSAVTDGIKKAATHLGVALNLYTEVRAEEQEQQAAQQQSQQPVAQGGDEVALPFQVQKIASFFEERAGVPRRDWLNVYGLSAPENLSARLARAILSGEDPQVQELCKIKAIAIAELKASAAS